MANFLEFTDEEFDDRQVPVSTGIAPDPLPPGRYMLQCEKGDMTDTKSGSGIIFKVLMAVLNGDHAGRTIFSYFNIKNKSVQAVTIGVGELKALVAALGITWETFRDGDTDTILYKPFEAEIGMEKENPDNINPNTGKPYAPRNRIIKYIIQTDASSPDFKPTARPSARVAAPKPAMKPVIDDTDDVPF